MYEAQDSPSLHSDQSTVTYAPGTMVKVTQQIPQRDDVYSTIVTGKVVRQERQESGSWYARNVGKKLWLDRLILEKADGEKSILNLDEFTCVEVLYGPAAAPAPAPMVLPAEDRSGSLT